MSKLAGGRGSLRRLGAEQLAIGQLHWSTANYQPLQERALWDGLVRLYDEVRPDSCNQSSCCSGYGGLSGSHRERLQGLVQAVGVSNYGPQQLQKIARYLQQRGIPLATAQVGSYVTLAAALSASLDKQEIPVVGAFGVLRVGFLVSKPCFCAAGSVLLGQQRPEPVGNQGSLR